MGAKLIFYEDTFGFCPLVRHGCAGCFVPPKCVGPNDKTVAFNLRKTKGTFEISRHRPRKPKEIE